MKLFCRAYHGHKELNHKDSLGGPDNNYVKYCPITCDTTILYGTTCMIIYLKQIKYSYNTVLLQTCGPQVKSDPLPYGVPTGHQSQIRSKPVTTGTSSCVHTRMVPWDHFFLGGGGGGRAWPAQPAPFIQRLQSRGSLFLVFKLWVHLFVNRNGYSSTSSSRSTR